MQNSYEFYNTYRALKLHFTTNNYDITKYNSKTKRSIRYNKGVLARLNVLTQKYKKFHLIEYMVSNFINGDDYGGVFSVDGDDVYLEWKKRIQNLTYNFKKDINTIKDILNNTNDMSTLFEINNNNHPMILKLFYGKHIMLETIVILDNIYNFMQKSNINDDILWDKFSRLVLKYKPFLNVNKEKYESIVKNTYA